MKKPDWSKNISCCGSIARHQKIESELNFQQDKIVKIIDTVNAELRGTLVRA